MAEPRELGIEDPSSGWLLQQDTRMTEWLLVANQVLHARN
jgi:hypothetical protein